MRMISPNKSWLILTVLFQIIHGAAGWSAPLHHGRGGRPGLPGRVKRPLHPELRLRARETLRRRPLLADQPGQAEGVLRAVRQRDGRPRDERPHHPGQLVSCSLS